MDDIIKALVIVLAYRSPELLKELRLFYFGYKNRKDEDE